MFYVDNPTGVPVMPPVAAVSSLATLYFTEGGNGIPPTYPGPDWFNIIQSELLEILRQANIKPDKNTTNQIMTALKKLFITNSGSAGAIAGLTGQNNTFPYFTGKDTMALTPLSAFVRSILGKNSASEFIKAIGLSPDILLSKGPVTALSSTAQGNAGLQMYEVYNNGYSVTEANRQLQALRINSGRYEGLWRYLNANGGINWYFLFLAVYESEGKCFSLSDRMTICEKALRLGLVVPFMTGCRYEAGQRLTIDGTLFFVNIAGTTGETLPDITSVAPGDFVRTGSAVLECLKSPSNRIPAAWQYFFLDVAPDLYTPVAPDSTDSYPALWFACIAEFADSAWLQEPAGIGGSSRWEIIKQVAKFNIVAEINPVASLVNVFQHNLAPGDRAYAQCFCQDNAEVYAGLRALKTLADLAGDTTAATEYTAAMKTIRAGLLALFVPEQKRFLTYYNETDYPAEPGEGRFVDKDRFSVAPWRFGVLETQEEVERYGRQVLDAIQSAYPDLFTANYDGIDTFAMSDFFAFVAKVTTSQTAATAAIRRLQIRATSAVTVADVAAAISVTAWGKIPQFRACDFMRINGHSVLGGGDITLGAATTMEPQSDIRDRTEGRLALPDAFGFGRIFNTNETVRFDSENDFLVWVKQVTPGEYFVEGGNKIIPNVLFSGIVSIRWIESRYATPSPINTAKAIIFYGVNGHIYYNRYWTTGNGYLIDWESLKVTSQDIIALLSGLAPGTTDTWYGTGSLILAAYNGQGNADPDRRIKRGYSYPGSRLSAVELMCYGTTGTGVKYNGSVSVYVQGSGGGMPGTYRALSGNGLGSAGSASVMIGLFIRVA